MEKKTCRRCLTMKTMEEFDLDRSRKDQRRSICKECRHATERRGNRASKVKTTKLDPLGNLHRDALVLLMKRHIHEYEDILQILANQRKIPANLVSTPQVDYA